MSAVLHRTIFGRSVIAIGQNQRAATLAGIKVGQVRFATYVLCATLASLCGFLLSGFSGGALLNMGEECSTPMASAPAFVTLRPA